MAKRTPIYSYYTMQYSDIWWPKTDFRNMSTAESQLLGQYKFVGPGILTGWDVLAMPLLPDVLPNPLTADLETTIAEREILRDAPLNSNLNYQYIQMGSPAVIGNEDIWAQVVKVTHGNGIVGVYAARTDDPYYFRLQTAGVYDVFATPGLCLISQGIADIVIPDPPQDNYAQTHVTTYLGCVTLTGGIITPVSTTTMSAGTGTTQFATNVNYDFIQSDLIIPVGIPTQSRYVYIDDSTSPYYVTTPYDINITAGTNFTINRLAKIYEVNCYDQRIDLNSLSGQLQQALGMAFYRHVHLGGYNNPSKIQLSTYLILNAYGPTNVNGSPIFQVYNDNGTIFTWNASDYGIPIIRLNNQIIPPSEYRVEPNTGRIYLRNSLPSDATLQIILPLAAQVSLTTANDSSITAAKVYLTGTFPSIFYGNTNSNGHVAWDATKFQAPMVYLRGVLQPSSRYIINASQGYIQFVGGLSSELTNPQNSDLLVILTALKYEIEGMLSSKRVEHIDASTFNRGILSPSRIGNIDHVGQVRFKEPAILHPSIRLFDSGDHQTYYPELTNVSLQYNTDVLGFYQTVTLPSGDVVIMTKRGLMFTDSLFTNITTWNSWDVDFGKPVQVIENILQAPPNTNKFNQIYVRTATEDMNGTPIAGKIFFSENYGATWNELVLPTIATSRRKIRPIPTAFWVSTERESYKVGRITYYRWSYHLYLGTYQYGLFHAVVKEGQKQGDWTWTKINFQNSGGNPITIHDIVEVCTLKTVQNADEITESYERSIYLAADDGFYASLKNQNGYLRNTVNWLPKKLYWLREGSNINNLLIGTATDVYLTHSAKQIIISADNSDGTTTTTTYWQHPLQTTGPWMFPSNYISTPIVASTTSDNDLAYSTFIAGPNLLITSDGSILDGITLGIGDTVLIKNFAGTGTSSYYNGLWNYQGNFLSFSLWTRDISLTTTLQASTSNWLQVTGGTKGTASAWNYVPVSSAGLDASPLIFEDLWTRGFNTSLPENIINLSQLPNDTRYWVMTSQRLYKITDTKASNNWNYPSLDAAAWDYTSQNYPKCIIPIRAYNNYYITGSQRGIWKSTNVGIDSWARNTNVFSVSDTDPTQRPTIYNSKTLTKIYTGDYSLSQQSQSITFNTIQAIDDNFVMEKDYKNYYIAPWNSNNADVILYENNNISKASYILDPIQGQISFDRSRPNNDNIAATIVRQGAFISGVGTTPHEEIFNTFVTGNTPVTKLRTQLLPTDTTIEVQDITRIPIDTQYLEVVYHSNSERIPIIISNGVITIPTIRTTTITYPSNSTNVFISNIMNIKGVEDYISLSEFDQTYHMASVAGANIIQLSIGSKKQYPPMWENFYDISDTGVSRGPQNAIYQDLLINNFDEVASASTLNVSLLPSILDQSTVPQAIYYLYNPSLSGQDMRIGCDQGIWIYNNNMWNKESDLDNATKVYTITNIDDNLSALTDNGVWTKDISNVWTKSTLYTQPTFDYSTGGWFEDNYEAYSKNDGIVFIKTGTNIDGFISDHFDPVDGKNVYGLYKDQFFRTDSEGNKKLIDALYLSTEIGLYGITEGSRDGQFTAFLGGREMFNNSQTHIVNNETVPVKFYKITRSPRQNAVPLICLTNDGIRIVRNWRWCDPVGTDALDFVVEATVLTGYSVNCFTWVAVPNGEETTYKLFVGTNKGVWRSFNEGYSFEKCERVGGNDIAIFDLKAIGNCIFAATQDGIFTSPDDGDHWYVPSDGISCATFNNNISAGEFFQVTDPSTQRNFKAQTFTTPTNVSTLNKIGLYFGVDDSISTTDIRRNNTLNIEIWDTNSGIPNAPLIGINTFIYRASGKINVGLHSYADINSNTPQPVVEIGLTTNLTWTLDQYPTQTTQVYIQDILKPDGYTLDNINGTITFNPPLSGYTNTDLNIILNANYNPYFGFKSFEINPVIGIASNTQYAIVAYENIGTGSTYAFQMFKSNLSNPYSDGNLYTGTGGLITYPSSWIADTDKDYYFKTYYSGLPVPIETTYSIDFTDNDVARGCVITTNDELSMRTKFAIITLVDNSRSSTWAIESDVDLSQQRVYIGNLLETLMTQTQQGGFSPSNVDLWFYGSGDKSITRGFTTSITLIKSNLTLHTGTGLISAYIDSTMRAISGLNYQGVVDTIIYPSVNNTTRITPIYNYMSTNNLIRMPDVRNDYDTHIDHAVVLKILPPTSISTTTPIPLTDITDNIQAFKYNILDTDYPYIDLQIGGVSVKRDTFTNFRVGVAFTYPVGVGTSNSFAVIDNVNGTITFSSDPLSSQLTNDDLRVSLRTDWDGEQATIISNDITSTYLINTYAQSFTPVALIFTDGDNVGSGDTSLATLAANSAWDEDGVKLHIFNMGTSALDKHSRYMADNTNGYQFGITDFINNTTEATNDLLHNGKDTLFTAHWQKSFDVDTPVWFKNTNIIYTEPEGTNVVAQFRFMPNKTTWTDWVTIANDAPYIVNNFVYGFEYDIVMEEGWNSISTSPIYPTVSSLQYTLVEPSTKFYVTDAYPINGMLFEYLLSPAQNIPPTGQTEWGIIRSNSSDVLDMENVFQNRHGCLPNRQKGLRFIPQRMRPTSGNPSDGLITTTTDYQTYKVYETTGALALWTTRDTINVYVDVALADPSSYQLFGNKGTVYFNTAFDPSLNVTVRVVITTPELITEIDGELTYTFDYRTYYLTNGGWPNDATAIVLVNDNICHGGYWTNPSDGTITFATERQSTDIVSVYIQHSQYFRVGVIVNNYNTSADVTIDNYGLYYTNISNSDLIFRYNNPQLPSLIGAPILSNNNSSIYSRMTLNYTFDSGTDGTIGERDTQTRWYREYLTAAQMAVAGIGTVFTTDVDITLDAGDIIIPVGFSSTDTRIVGISSTASPYYTTTDFSAGFGPVSFSVIHNLTLYNNRVTEPQSDVGVGITVPFSVGDIVYTTVAPSDGVNTGRYVTSNSLILRGKYPPYAWNPYIISVQPEQTKNGYRYVPVGGELKAQYNFRDLDNPSAEITFNPDLPQSTIIAPYANPVTTNYSAIIWYNQDSSIYYEGAIIPPNYTQKGDVINFIVTPYDGEDSNSPVASNYVIVGTP